MSLSLHLGQAVARQCCSQPASTPACGAWSTARASLSLLLYLPLSVATRKDDTGHKEPPPQGKGMLCHAQRWRAAAACFWSRLPLPGAHGSSARRVASAGEQLYWGREGAQPFATSQARERGRETLSPAGPVFCTEARQHRHAARRVLLSSHQHLSGSHGEKRRFYC